MKNETLKRLAQRCFGRLTLALYGAAIVLFIGLPWLFTRAQSGSHKVGFPIRFYWFDASPPPFFGSRFEPLGLIANLVMYYGFAVLVSWLVDRVRNARRGTYGR